MRMGVIATLRIDAHPLHGFARTGGLFDQDVLRGVANIGDPSYLVWSQFLGGRHHGGADP